MRKLKAEKVDKSKIEVEVKKLLDLKARLVTAQGNPSVEAASNLGPGQKKKKGKTN